MMPRSTQEEEGEGKEEAQEQQGGGGGGGGGGGVAAAAAEEQEVEGMKIIPALLPLAPHDDSKPLNASAALCQHIQRQGFHTHLFSDITLTFLSKDYPLHRIILCQSSYFFSLLSGPWKEHGKPRIQLHIDDPNVTPEGLELSLAYLYGLAPSFTGDNVMSVLAAACFLCLENLCDQCVHFILQDLRVETFVRYQLLSDKHCYGRFADSIRNACWCFLCTHASRELLHVLPKLPLQVLCRLLKSDELWVLSEAERFKLAKQALIDWQLSQMKSSSSSFDGLVPRKTRGKSLSARKSARNLSSAVSTRSRNLQSGSRTIFKNKGNRKKDAAVSIVEQKGSQSLEQKDSEEETDLKKLKRLWDEGSGNRSEGCKEDFRICADLFNGGGIIFAHMEADEVLQAKMELEDANLPPDAANDSIWHSVLLKAHVLKFRDTQSLIDVSSEEEDDEELDDDEDDDEDDNDDDEVDYEDDEESSDRDTSNSDGWSTDRSIHDEDSNSSEGRGRDGHGINSLKRLKGENISLVCFTCLESNTLDFSDGKRRKTTGGFTWTAKPNIGMRLGDFPPFRFGAEFVLKDKRWTPCLDSKSREVFYGGSMWKVVASNSNLEKEGWHFGLHCRLPSEEIREAHMYQDRRKKVHFMAKLYIKTTSGLRCVTGKGLRSSHHHCSSSKHTIGIHLGRQDLVEDEPLRVSVVVQLIDD